MVAERSSIALLLATVAVCVRLSGSESDPLPPSLLDLVIDAPVSSIGDLQMLLGTDSVEEEPDDKIHSRKDHHRLPRSPIALAEPAQQAVCKVRTEVLEVTRSMHDRTNAHFILWPPCVEVERCSGCCNSRASQCVAVVKEMRQLQMTKITYVNMRPHFEKIIVPVEDHVKCSCQTIASAHAARSSTPRKPQSTPSPPQRVLPKAPSPHLQSKEELHRHDVLKQNQRLILEDSEAPERPWQSKYTLSRTAAEPWHTFTNTDYRPLPRHTLTHGDYHTQPRHGLTLMQPAAVWDAAPTGRPLSNRMHQEEGREPWLQHNSGDDNGKQQKLQHQGYGLHRPTTASGSNVHQAGYNQPAVSSYHWSQSDMASHVDIQSEGSSSQYGQSEWSSRSKVFSSPTGVEKVEEKTEQWQGPMEEENRYLQLHQPHPSKAQPSPPSAVTDTISSSALPPALHTPSPWRRRRKHRRRISKAAMRAMIRVVS
ncbi:platelet-derived growth factor beta polypeptide a [Denticeps clupeoides]|uniref:Platelet-derived growth factor (PDGF) family profile domain-containing protein n=1 Tax=Denticeps clupeoides TaxID=299321 RepID=A0AAY4AHT7_9TELE|nr:uncharacterized protein LOC114786463 [Denticeps clupeoides]